MVKKTYKIISMYLRIKVKLLNAPFILFILSEIIRKKFSHFDFYVIL